MKYILIPLFFIMLIAVTVQMVNFMEPNFSGEYSTNIDVSNQQLTDAGVTSIVFNVTLLGGFLALFTSVVAVGILAGLNISIFGSTVQISSRSQNIIYNSMFYGGLWGIFSVLSTIGINGFGLFSLPILGYIFYGVLTLIYILGINEQIQTSG